MNNIAMQFATQFSGGLTGTIPQVWVLLNEISATTAVPFAQLFNPVNDPTNAPSSQTIGSKRWYLQSTIAPFPGGNGLVNLASLKDRF